MGAAVIGPAWNERDTPSREKTWYHPGATEAAGAWAETTTARAPVVRKLRTFTCSPPPGSLPLAYPPGTPVSGGEGAAGRPDMLNACARAGPAGTTGSPARAPGSSAVR